MKPASRPNAVGAGGINLPGLNVTVGGMLDALEAVAGPAARARVVFKHDARIAGIVDNWVHPAAFARQPAGADPGRQL
jgi:hypothetical protein